MLTVQGLTVSTLGGESQKAKNRWGSICFGVVRTSIHKCKEKEEKEHYRQGKWGPGLRIKTSQEEEEEEGWNCHNRGLKITFTVPWPDGTPQLSLFRKFPTDASVGGDNVNRSGVGSVFTQRWKNRGFSRSLIIFPGELLAVSSPDGRLTLWSGGEGAGSRLEQQLVSN